MPDMAAHLKNFPHHHYTLKGYFALEHVGEARYEYWDGDILCVSGGSERYYTISENLRTLAISSSATSTKASRSINLFGTRRWSYEF